MQDTKASSHAHFDESLQLGQHRVHRSTRPVICPWKGIYIAAHSNYDADSLAANDS